MRRPPLLIALAVAAVLAASVFLPRPAVRSVALGEHLGSLATLPDDSKLEAWSFVIDQDADQLPELQAILLNRGSVDWGMSLRHMSILRNTRVDALLLQGTQGESIVRRMSMMSNRSWQSFITLGPSGWLHWAGTDRNGQRAIHQVLPDQDRTLFSIESHPDVFAYSELFYPDGESQLLQFSLTRSEHVTLRADASETGVMLWEYPLWESAQANERMTVMPVDPPGVGSHFMLVQRFRPATMDYGAGLGFDLLANQTGELLDWISPDPVADDRNLHAVEAIMSPRGSMLPWFFCIAREKSVAGGEQLWSAMLLNFSDEEIELLPASQTLSARQVVAQVGLMPRVEGGEFARLYLQRSTLAGGAHAVELAYCADWRESATWTCTLATTLAESLESGSLLARWVDDRDGDGHAEIQCAAHLVLPNGKRQLITQVISGASGKALTQEHRHPLARSQ